MSSFCCTEIRARCASKAVDSSESRVSIVVRGAAEVVGDVAEERRRVGVDAAAPVAVREPAHRLAQRQHRAAYLGDLALERVDAHASRWCARGRTPTSSTSSTSISSCAGDLLVAVDDRVADGVDDRGRSVARARARVPSRSSRRVVQLAALAVPDGHDEVGADEHVDLAGLDRVLGVDVPERLEDEEQAVVVALELRALVRRARASSTASGCRPNTSATSVELGRVGLVQADPDEVAVARSPCRRRRGQVVDAAVDRRRAPRRGRARCRRSRRPG